VNEGNKYGKESLRRKRATKQRARKQQDYLVYRSSVHPNTGKPAVVFAGERRKMVRRQERKLVITANVRQCGQWQEDTVRLDGCGKVVQYCV
jgi:hypothetical protein